MAALTERPFCLLLFPVGQGAGRGIPLSYKARGDFRIREVGNHLVEFMQIDNGGRASFFKQARIFCGDLVQLHFAEGALRLRLGVRAPNVCRFSCVCSCGESPRTDTTTILVQYGPLLDLFFNCKYLGAAEVEFRHSVSYGGFHFTARNSPFPEIGANLFRLLLCGALLCLVAFYPGLCSTQGPPS